MDLDYDQEKKFGDIGYEVHDDTADHPNNCTGVIYQMTPNKPPQMIGTGFLVSSDLVLTAGHNIFDRFTRKTRQNLYFYPGVTGKLTSTTAQKVVDFRIREEYKFSQDPTKTKFNDFALLKIENKVFYKEYVQLGLNYKQNTQKLGIVGYRGLACDWKNAPQSSVWLHSHQHQVEDSILYHRLSTTHGNSGSGIFVKRGQKSIAVSIHFGGFMYKNEDYNGARTITDDVFCDLILWEKQMSSEIKFCSMIENTTQIQFMERGEWLKSINKKISVILDGFYQPSVQDLKKQIQKMKFSSPSAKKMVEQSPKIKTQQNNFSQPINPANNSNQNVGTQYLEKKKDVLKNVQQQYLDDLVKKLGQISPAQKQEITSLTLKVLIQQRSVKNYNNVDVIAM